MCVGWEPNAIRSFRCQSPCANYKQLKLLSLRKGFSLGKKKQQSVNDPLEMISSLQRRKRSLCCWMTETIGSRVHLLPKRPVAACRLPMPPVGLPAMPMHLFKPSLTHNSNPCSSLQSQVNRGYTEGLPFRSHSLIKTQQ